MDDRAKASGAPLLTRALLTVAAIQYGLIPPVVDFTRSHVFNPDWPAHARFHMVWLVATASVAAIYVVFQCWAPVSDRDQSVRHACIPGWLVLLGFFLSLALLSFYGGSLSDLDEPIRILGVDGNVFSFGLATAFQAWATLRVFRPPAT